MQIKYTIEILTKDIQDIEKLVGNLRNSKEASAIELDLALSKLRNVYEILTMIKADRLHELVSDTLLPESEPAPEPDFAPEPEPVPESAQEPEHIPEPEPETEAATAPEPETEPAPSTETTDPTILAEKFSAESSINENLAEKLGNDADAKLVGQPIDNISRNIGINDRFLIIRELFDGDSERFTIMVNELDNAENYQAANSILNERFAGVMDHEGVEVLASLLKRRYIR
ncbi:MAG: hypothetical protein U9R49_06480 [Bacteroidota bacterium]|nr:hypothetical protein [Bacteroidota bacterium]